MFEKAGKIGTCSARDRRYSAAEDQCVCHGRYRAVEPVQRDGNGETWLARRVTDDRKVLVKSRRVANVSSGMRMRCELECRVLQQVDSTWFVPLLEASFEGDLLWSVMPFIEGESLAQPMRERRLSVAEALQIGIGLFSALRDLHVAQILHANVKPSNIILSFEQDTLHAKLTDLVVGRQLLAETAVNDRLLESARHRSPEQAGSVDLDVAEPADLYSAGVVLYECLAGKPPYDGQAISEILFQHMAAPVPELSDCQRHVPRALQDVVQRLLQKDPRNRYQSAAGVLADLQLILCDWQQGSLETCVTIGALDQRTSLTEPAFVARTEEAERVAREMDRVDQGTSQLVVVEGDGGSGKSRLLGELSRRAAAKGMRVFRGAGTDDSHQKPYQLFRGVVASFVELAQVQPDVVLRVANAMQENADCLLAAFPDLLGQVKWPAAATTLDSFGKPQVVQALAEFVRALSQLDRPVMIALDDSQWADMATFDVIQCWNRTRLGQEDEPRRVLLLLAFRSEDVPSQHCLRKLGSAVRLSLLPLSSDEIRQLAESMAGPLPDEVIRLVQELSVGVPFMATAVLRGLVESGALVARGSGWQVEPAVLSDLTASGQAIGFVAQRIELLPAKTLELLSVGAVLGKEFDLELAAILARQTPTEAITALTEARRRHLLWAGVDHFHCRFVHGKIRDLLIDRLPPDKRRHLHWRAGCYLEIHHPEAIANIAYHFDAAGESVRACPFARQAAEQAQTQNALDLSEQYFRMARKGEHEAPRAERCRIARGLGDVLMLQGHIEEATECFQRAAELAEGRLAAAEMLERLGEAAFRRGDIQRSASYTQQALNKLGYQVPQTEYSFAVHVVREIAVQCLHTCFPRWLVHRVRQFPNESEKCSFRLLRQLAHGFWFTKNRLPLLWAHLRGMNLAERFPATSELAAIYADHGPAMTLIPRFQRGLRYAQQSAEIYKSLGDPWGRSQALSYCSLVLYAASRFRESVALSCEAMDLLESAGAYWYTQVARSMLSAALYRLGDLPAAAAVAQEHYQAGIELGDEAATRISSDIWARATLGAIPAEALAEEVDRTEFDAQATVQVMLAQAVQLLEMGNVDRAAEMIQRAVEVMDSAQVRNAFTLPILAWQATCWRRKAQLTSGCSLQPRRRAMRIARRAVRRALRMAHLCRNDLPHIYREQGILLAMAGRGRAARRALNRSLEIASQQDARFETAQTLQAMGTIGAEFDWPDAASCLSEGDQIWRRLVIDDRGEKLPTAEQRSVSLSLIDRFGSVLKFGRRIASALTPDAVFTEVQDAMQHLLRGEHCRLLVVTSTIPHVHIQSLEEHAPLDMVLIEAAVRQGSAVVLDNQIGQSQDHPVTESIACQEMSALCTPILMRDKTVACIYVTHQHMPDLFGAEEIQLANFLAAIAGAALENAEGFRELSRLNETLEQRVAERTAAVEERAQQLAQSNRQLQSVTGELRQTEAELRQAMKDAEAANEAKGRFLATMSHELRTPMNGVLGMIELSRGAAVDPRQMSHLKSAKQAGNALMRLLNDILDFSKIDAGKMKLEDVAFCLHDAVVDAMRIFTMSERDSRVELEFNIAPDVPRQVIGDSGRLRQVIINLVGNALKFTRQGEVVVDVAVDKIEEQQVELHFRVRDTGMGIPADKQDRIFESFNQADVSTTRRFGGTGLGLSISAELVKLMGGRIWLESELGEGSCFHFSTRLGHTLSEQPLPIKQPPDAFRSALVVGVNASGRAAIRELLERNGWQVQTAPTRVSALRLLQSQPQAGKQFTLVFVGGYLEAATDQWSTSQKLNQFLDADRQSTVLVSAFGTNSEKEAAECLSAPRMFSLHPFFTYDELKEVVNRAVERIQGDTAADRRKDCEPAAAALRILLVEDCPVNQEVAVGLLSIGGHQVDVADNGQIAIERWQNADYDVVLMDIEMPDMDGFEVTSKIRALEAECGERTPIIAMTAHANSVCQQACREAKMDGFISKPISPETLFNAVESAVNQRSASDMVPPVPV